MAAAALDCSTFRSNIDLVDKLRAMESFVRIVECGSLTAAGEALRRSLPSMVRTLAALESELDVRLLNRTTRRISLTDEGSEFLEHCRRVLAEVDDAEAALSARRVEPRGRLRVTASVMFGRLYVAPVLTSFTMRYPAVQTELLLLDRSVDLVEEGLDVAVRIGRLPDSSLVAIPVGMVRRMLCASPAYLKRAGTPKSPADLARHRCVSSSGRGRGHEWDLGSGRRATQVRVNPAFSSNQLTVALDAAVSGAGIGQFLDCQVQALLEAGQLRRVLAEYEPDPLPVNVIHSHARMPSRNVRSFVDWAIPRLRARLKA
jgi:DNA-binding transcriptional LysR family regulator